MNEYQSTPVAIIGPDRCFTDFFCEPDSCVPGYGEACADAPLERIDLYAPRFLSRVVASMEHHDA